MEFEEALTRVLALAQLTSYINRCAGDDEAIEIVKAYDLQKRKEKYEIDR